MSKCYSSVGCQQWNFFVRHTIHVLLTRFVLGYDWANNGTIMTASD